MTITAPSRRVSGFKVSSDASFGGDAAGGVAGQNHERWLLPGGACLGVDGFRAEVRSWTFSWKQVWGEFRESRLRSAKQRSKRCVLE